MPALLRLFQRVHQALRPGGLFVFDLVEPGKRPGRTRRYHERAGEDWATLVDVEEDPATRTLIRRITAFRKINTLYRRVDEIHRLRLYSASEVAQALREIGFRVRRLRGYGELRFRPHHTGFLAVKVAPKDR